MVKQLLFEIAEALGLLWLARFYNRYEPMILMYHRIVKEPLLPGIAPEVFEQELKYLKRHFRVVPMAQLAEEIRTNTVKTYSVAITFDDGHGDFYTHAWPLLKQYQLPAALYVTTGFLDQKCWLWPDLLRYLLIKTECESVRVEEIGELPLGSTHILKTWNSLGDYCLTLNSEERMKFLAQLAVQLEVEPGEYAKAPFSSVTWDQLREMNSEGLEVGSHTLSHPILSSLTPAQLEDELTLSYQRIQTEIGQPPLGICYPNGMAKDISKDVERVGANLYRYGLVAYPAEISANKMMHLGRWAGANNFRRFKQVSCRLSRNDNFQGEYR